MHKRAMGMQDPENGRFKAFLIVGVAYYLVAIMGSIFLLMSKGAGFTMPSGGFWWSLAAGVVGALGALFVLLAFGAKGHPAVVMSIIFGIAPVINAFVAIGMHPPEGGASSIAPQFYIGVFLALAGGALVTLYKPGPPLPKKAKTAAVVEAPAETEKES